MLQLAEWGHPMWFGRISPHGMLQAKHTQSLALGSVVAWGCSFNTGVRGWGC